MEEKKNVQMHFRVTEEEKECIYQKMEQVGISSIGTYLRKMALNGYCITMDMSDVKEMRRLLRSTSNNINQYAKKANETGSIYVEDVANIQENQQKLWDQMKNLYDILSRIA